MPLQIKDSSLIKVQVIVLRAHDEKLAPKGIKFAQLHSKRDHQDLRVLQAQDSFELAWISKSVASGEVKVHLARTMVLRRMLASLKQWVRFMWMTRIRMSTRQSKFWKEVSWAVRRVIKLSQLTSISALSKALSISWAQVLLQIQMLRIWSLASPPNTSKTLLTMSQVPVPTEQWISFWTKTRTST